MGSPYLLQMPQAFQVFGLVGRLVAALGVPQRLRETLDHLMLGGVQVAKSGGERSVYGRYAGGSIGGNLFPDAEMQPHVQERIGLSSIRREIAIQVVARNIAVVLRVHRDDIRDLRFER